jgi:hypothetical protein
VVGPLLLPRRLASVCSSSEGESEVSFLGLSGGGMVECVVQIWCLLRCLVPCYCLFPVVFVCPVRCRW